MNKRWLFIILILLNSAGLVLANENANELYVKASAETRNMKSESNSHVKTLKHYNAAKRKIDNIISKFSSTKLATDLSSGATKISGYTLDEFYEVGVGLNQLAKIEEAPSSLWIDLLMASSKATFNRKANDILQFALAYSEGGNYLRASVLFDKVFMLISKNNDKSTKDAWFVVTALEYAKAFKNKRAVGLLLKAEEIEKRNKDNPRFKSKDFHLNLAKGYMRNGEKKKANTLLSMYYAKEKTKAYKLKNVAVSYSNAGQKTKAINVFKEALEGTISVSQDKKYTNFSDTAFKALILEYTKIQDKEKIAEVLLTAINKLKKGEVYIIPYMAMFSSLYTNIGDKKQAYKILDQAKNKLEVKYDKYYVSHALKIAEAYDKIGANYYINSLLKKISLNPLSKTTESLQDISITLSKIGLYEKAIKMANKITDKKQRNIALGWIVSEYAENQKFIQATKLAMTMSGGRKAGSLKKIIREKIKTEKSPDYRFTLALYELYKNLFSEMNQS